jgi:hypothetical protein
MRGGMRRGLSATAGRRFSTAHAAIWTVTTSDSACTHAAAFRFGRPRHDVAPASARLVLEPPSIDPDAPGQQVSLSPGEALRPARALTRLVDDLTFVERAA